MAISNLSSGVRPGVCLSTNRPTTPYEGQVIYETDTNKVYVWDGSAWSLITSANGGGSNVRLAYQTRTTDYAISSNTLAGAANVFASNLTWTADGTSTYWLELYTALIASGYTGISASNSVFLVNSSGTSLGQIALSEKNNVAGERAYGSMFVKFPYTPSAGSTSVNIRIQYNSGDNTGTFYGGTGGVGTYMPSWCAVYGPALA